MHSCVYICVCYRERCLTPNRCHYFPLASSHLSMSAEVFLLFCLLYIVCVSVHAHAHVDECVVRGGRERERHACICVRLCVGVCFIKFFRLSKSSRHFLVPFWLVEECGKSLFLLKFLQQRSDGASSVTVSRESVQVTGTNTIFHLIREQAFELTPYVA